MDLRRFDTPDTGAEIRPHLLRRSSINSWSRGRDGPSFQLAGPSPRIELTRWSVGLPAKYIMASSKQMHLGLKHRKPINVTTLRPYYRAERRYL